MIVGNFPEQGSEAECTKWCLKFCNCQLTHSYVKGAFRKLLRFKFDNMQVRDQVVEAFGKARLSNNTMRIWCVVDSPLPVRVERTFLFWCEEIIIVLVLARIRSTCRHRCKSRFN